MKRPRLFLLGTCIVMLFSLAANANESTMENEGWVLDNPSACSEQCTNISVTMTNQGGLCSAYWICDGLNYMVTCNQTTCDCYKYGEKIGSFAFSACDSRLLVESCCHCGT